MQFYCRGVSRSKYTPQFITVIYLLFRVVENHTFYRYKIHVFYHCKLKAAMITSSTSATELYFVYQIWTFH